MRADTRHIFGADGLCGAHFPCAELHHRRSSVKVIGDEVQAAPGDVTIIALGPLSNIAAALQQQPDLASQIGHLIILGGTVSGPGNVTPAAEFNIYCDAEAARDVFRSPGHQDRDPDRRHEPDPVRLRHAAKDSERQIRGRRSCCSACYRVRFARTGRILGLEGIHLHDAVAVVAAMHPEMFTMERMHGDVESDGTLTHGATIFDRRRHPENRPNLDVAVDVDVDAVTDCIYKTLNAAG